jgi:hypothetical protein
MTIGVRMQMRSPQVEPRTDAPPLRGGFSFTGSANSKGVQEIGSRLSDCVFQRELYNQIFHV